MLKGAGRPNYTTWKSGIYQVQNYRQCKVSLVTTSHSIRCKMYQTKNVPLNGAIIETIIETGVTFISFIISEIKLG